MTLTETAKQARLWARILGAALVLIIIIRALMLIYNIVFVIPPPPPPEQIADMRYGKIPALIIERTPINLPENYIVTLDLIAAQLPDRPIVAKVFPILKQPFGFLSTDRAKELAATFSFNNEPVKISAIESLWTGLNRTLRVNDQTLNFEYRYNYEADPSVFVAGNLTSRALAINQGNGIMQRHQVALGNLGLQTGNLPVYLIKYQNFSLQPTNLISETAAARVDFPRNDISYTLDGRTQESYPFSPPHFIGTLVNVFLSNPSQGNVQTLELNFTLWRFNEMTGSTYPLITSDLAWKSIQQDPALFTVYLGNLDTGPLDRTSGSPLIESIRIREVFLAYYDTEVEQAFIQPIWVFKGQGNIEGGGELDWIGYVPAVHPDSLVNLVTPTP